jgi:hypothetical protein
MTSWHYSIQRQIQGPVDEETIRNLIKEGTLAPTDLVWNPAMGDQWQTVAATPELNMQESPAIPVVVEPVAAEARSREPLPPGEVSVMKAMEDGWHRMVRMLFKPFDISLWCMMGLAAWILSFGESGEPFGTTFRLVSHFYGKGDGTTTPGLPWANGFGGIHTGLMFIIGGVLILVLGLSLVLQWVSCRARFALLDQIVHKRGDFAGPWRRYATQGLSLFGWRLAFGFIVAGIMGGIAALVVMSMGGVAAFTTGSGIDWKVIIMAVAVLTPLLLVVALIASLLNNFVVPIMYWEECTASAAWRIFLHIARGYTAPILNFFLMQFVLGLALAALIIITCCGLCTLLIPYVGVVVMLPATVFMQCYTLAFIAQISPRYSVEP